LKDTEYHVPVLLEESIGLLLENKDTTASNIYVDCTLGGGGYTEEILKRTDDRVNVVAVDRDINSIEYCKKRLERFKDRIVYCCDNFANISDIIRNSQVYKSNMKISGIVLDLGLSSYQLDHEEGFSYLRDTGLDMRADKTQELQAKDVLNEYTEKELLKIFKGYGELRYNRQITRDIIGYRKVRRFERTSELVDLLKKKIPFRYVNKDLSKIFQALRIAVNDELKNLEKVLNDSVLFLDQGGRIAAICYHSLEDRIVKNFFRSNKELKVLTKKPVTASNAEIESNPKARSAKLRTAEKIQ
jgi:16S rRNA (cytosine1402-N4)-methyltransferase